MVSQKSDRLGVPVPNWTPPPSPDKTVWAEKMKGRYVRLEPLKAWLGIAMIYLRHLRQMPKTRSGIICPMGRLKRRQILPIGCMPHALGQTHIFLPLLIRPQTGLLVWPAI